LKLFLAIVPLVFVINGCASGGGTIPEGAAPLSTEEIAETFSGVQESYRSRDNPAVSAKGTFREGGEFEGTWRAGSQSGQVVGEWYAEDGKRCLSTTAPGGGNADLECHQFYRTGAVLTSVNDDGSVHGIHTLQPLE